MEAKTVYYERTEQMQEGVAGMTDDGWRVNLILRIGDGRSIVEYVRQDSPPHSPASEPGRRCRGRRAC